MKGFIEHAPPLLRRELQEQVGVKGRTERKGKDRTKGSEMPLSKSLIHFTLFRLEMMMLFSLYRPAEEKAVRIGAKRVKSVPSLAIN